MERRAFIQRSLAGIGAVAASPVFSAEPKNLAPVSVASFSFAIRLRAERAGQKPQGISDPLNYLDHCYNLGAGGIQLDFGALDAAAIKAIRDRADSYGMFIEGSVRLPRDASDVDRFDAELKTVKELGAKMVRTVMLGGRRYETFDTLEEFKAFRKESTGWLRLAKPVAEKHKVCVAFENHKDWRIDQMIEILREIDSEYIGACVDTGNNLSLLQDSLEVAKAFAPWACGVHLKDAGVEEYEDGFLLADVALGEGMLDVPQIVKTLRDAKPNLRISLEMSTRDPLKIPCFTDKYWATMPDVPGIDLARTMRMVRENKPEKPYPRISAMTLDEQIAVEEGNIKKSLAYVQEHLREML